MSNTNRKAHRNPLQATLVAALFLAAAIAGSTSAPAAGVCALVPNDHMPSEKMLQCGENLTVRAAEGARYQPLYKKGDPLPVGIRLNEGALLIEFHPAKPQEKFQILTPLAIAAVRGTKWAMDVTTAQTSTLVVNGVVRGDQPPPEPVRCSHRRAGRRYHPDRYVRGQRKRGEMSACGRFFRVLASEWRLNGRDLRGS